MGCCKKGRDQQPIRPLTLVYLPTFLLTLHHQLLIPLSLSLSLSRCLSLCIRKLLSPCLRVMFNYVQGRVSVRGEKTWRKTIPIWGSRTAWAGSPLILSSPPPQPPFSLWPGPAVITLLTSRGTRCGGDANAGVKEAKRRGTKERERTGERLGWKSQSDGLNTGAFLEFFFFFYDPC